MLCPIHPLLTWALFFRYPLENGLAARCIPATVIADFNAELHPRNARLMAHKPADPALPPEHTASQVGDWVFANLNFENSARKAN